MIKQDLPEMIHYKKDISHPALNTTDTEEFLWLSCKELKVSIIKKKLKVNKHAEKENKCYEKHN